MWLQPIKRGCTFVLGPGRQWRLLLSLEPFLPPWAKPHCPGLSSFPFQFLALDTQMLMGNRRYSLSPEEYIFGALNIYLDIIYIFSFFLQFFGSSQE